MNNLNISHLKKIKDLKFYCNKREKNQDGNRKIDNTPLWNKKGETKEDILKKLPLFVITAGIFKCS